MPHQKSTEERLAELELFKTEAKPIVDAYKAGQLVFRFVWVVGSLIVGAGVVLKSWVWITGNVK